MKISLPVAMVATAIALTACGGKSADSTQADAPQAAPGTSATAAPAAPTPEQRQRAEKLAQLEYATMEDAYLNDPKAQWATGATATSEFGQSQSGGASQFSRAVNIAGKPDNKVWQNDNLNLGFDSFEATFATPVHATEFRAVFQGRTAGAVSKLELKDSAGNYTTVWSGINEDPEEHRGPRTWFVRKFERTAMPVVAAKVTIANAVDSTYKKVDAVQLVGEP